MTQLIVILFLVASGVPAAEPPPAEDAATRIAPYRLPAPEDLTHLCWQRVYPVEGRHFTWDAFASKTPPAELVAWYRERVGDKELTAGKDGGGSWRWNDDGGRTRTLSIHPISAETPHRGCDRKPPEGSKSVIIMSR